MLLDAFPKISGLVKLLSALYALEERVEQISLTKNNFTFFEHCLNDIGPCSLVRKGEIALWSSVTGQWNNIDIYVRVTTCMCGGCERKKEDLLDGRHLGGSVCLTKVVDTILYTMALNLTEFVWRFIWVGIFSTVTSKARSCYNYLHSSAFGRLQWSFWCRK